MIFAYYGRMVKAWRYATKDGRSFLSQLLKEKTESAHSYIVFGSNTGPAIVTADGWKLRYYLSRNTIELFFYRMIRKN